MARSKQENKHIVRHLAHLMKQYADCTHTHTHTNARVNETHTHQCTRERNTHTTMHAWTKTHTQQRTRERNTHTTTHAWAKTHTHTQQCMRERIAPYTCNLTHASILQAALTLNLDSWHPPLALLLLFFSTLVGANLAPYAAQPQGSLLVRAQRLAPFAAVDVSCSVLGRYTTIYKSCGEKCKVRSGETVCVRVCVGGGMQSSGDQWGYFLNIGGLNSSTSSAIHTQGKEPQQAKWSGLVRPKHTRSVITLILRHIILILILRPQITKSNRWNNSPALIS